MIKLIKKLFSKFKKQTKQTVYYYPEDKDNMSVWLRSCTEELLSATQLFKQAKVIEVERDVVFHFDIRESLLEIKWLASTDLFNVTYKNNTINDVSSSLLLNYLTMLLI